MRNSGQTRYTTIEELISAIKENRDITEISQIISGIEDINQANRGSTALHIAAQKGHVELVSHLLAAGADVNKADNDGETALYVAALYGHVEIVAQLLAAGADVNKADNRGRTALHEAALYGHVEIVAQLLAAGADVNKANNRGRTALHEAAEEGHVEIVAHLIAYGADETLLTEADQVQYAEAIAEGKAILINNNRNSACALADTGRELQRVSIIQNHPFREHAESQEHENKLPELPECILAQIAAFGTDLPRPNSLTQEQIEQCAELGTESLESTDANTFNETDEKFVARAPRNTIENILNGNQNPANGHSHQI